MNKVFVDYNCSVCTTYGQWISKHDKQLVIESQEMLSNKEYELDTLVFKTDGINYYYSDAVIMSIASLGGFYKLIYVLKIFPKKIRDAVYKIVSKNRHLLSWNISTNLNRINYFARLLFFQFFVFFMVFLYYLHHIS